jgi:hypothetical protein
VALFVKEKEMASVLQIKDAFLGDGMGMLKKQGIRIRIRGWRNKHIIRFCFLCYVWYLFNFQKRKGDEITIA